MREAPVESSAPHLTSDSSERLFTTCGSTRSVKSQIEANGPPSSRAATIRCAAGIADRSRITSACRTRNPNDHSTPPTPNVVVTRGGRR